AEGAAVIAGHESGGDFCPRPAGADRHPVSERLCHRDDIGAYRLVLEGEPAPRTAEPGLDLVEHEEDAPFVTDPPHGREVPVGRDHHPRLTLDSLEQHGGDRWRLDGILQGGDVTVGDVPETVRE